jgi:hypothetical protein
MVGVRGRVRVLIRVRVGVRVSLRRQAGGIVDINPEVNLGLC